MAADQNDTVQNASSDGADRQNANMPQSSSGDGATSGIDLKSDLQEAVAPVKAALTQAVDDQRGAGADRLGLIASAISSAAPSFEQEMPQLASYIRDAGKWVESSASNIRDQKFDVLVDSVGKFARNQPAAAFGVAALSGFLLSRFLKSAAPAATAGAAPSN